MGECYTAAEPGAGAGQRLTHVAEQKKPGWRHAILMGRNASLADVDRSVRKKFPQMIIGPAVAKTKF
jgi:hypothetical protein